MPDKTQKNSTRETVRALSFIGLFYSPLQFLQPPRNLLRIGAAVERADAEIAFALRAKTAAGRDDHVCVIQNLVERLPARDTFRSPHPDVRRVHAAEHLQAGLLRAFAQNFRVAEIMFDKRVHLHFSFG